MTMNSQFSALNANGNYALSAGQQFDGDDDAFPVGESFLATHPFCDGDADSATSEVSELSNLLAQVASLLPRLLHQSNDSGMPSDSSPICSNALAAQLGNEGPPGAEGFTQAPYSSFQASSQGDPHLSFSGTTQNGSSRSAHWNNMQSHHDLLNSSSFEGGFRISSKTTVPQNGGTTMNGVVDVHTNYGRNDIRYDANGNASFESNGTWQSLTPGTKLNLGDGTSIDDSLSNQLTVSKTNQDGGTLSTILSANGQGGVDIQANGQNINAGGYLAAQGFTS